MQMPVAISAPSSAPASPPEGTRVYAVGDIHGRFDLMGRLLRLIERDAARPRPGQPTPTRIAVVFLGDYLDRGPQSREVVERLMQGAPASGPLAGAEWICLKGNHEEQAVRFVDELVAGAPWCRNGGLEAIRSYAGTIPAGQESDMAALQMLWSRSLPPSHLRFLARLPLLHREGDYVFAHAGIRPGVAIEDQEPKDLMWIRDDFLHDSRPLGAVVVHGHTPGPVPEIRPNRIGIDTKAYASGNLTAAVLEGTDKRFLVS